MSISASQIGYQLLNPPTVTLTAAIAHRVFNTTSSTPNYTRIWESDHCRWSIKCSNKLS